jgi:glycerol uptake facilitator-like aquaporin
VQDRLKAQAKYWVLNAIQVTVGPATMSSVTYNAQPSRVAFGGRTVAAIVDDLSRSPLPVPATEDVPEMSTGPRVAMEYAVEAAGTFVLVFTIASAAAGSDPWAPLAIGALLRAMVDAGLHLLGGHNPAVMLAVLICHQVGLRDAGAYWLVQLGAGLLAAVVVARAVVDPAQLAATATMSLAGRSLMAAFAADVYAFVAERSRTRAGV